ncbi:MAG TPA: L,D-transpeptidase family protein [Azospirillum sp.]|nr:L,D-transpeptidase family protein [Azospirillum sp.]
MTRFARLLLVLYLLPAGAAGAVAQEQVNQQAVLRDGIDIAIAARLAQDSRIVSGRPVELTPIRRFYAQRGFQPVWLDAEGSSKASAQGVLAVLREADTEGLSAADYHLDAIAANLDVATREERVALDLLLTDAVMKYGTHLRAGRVAPKSISIEFSDVKPKAVDAADLVLRASDAADPRAVLAALTPVRPEYAALKDALQRYRGLERAGGWPLVPAPQAAKLEPGMRDPAVKALRKRLAVTGEFDGRLDAKAAQSDIYDPPLRKAVERFQARHGLFVDGVVGAFTVSALNVTAAERVGQILASLERVRWMPDDFGERYVVVNVPDYTLKAVERGTPVQEMRVIVGTKVRRTPIFSSAITSIVLNPTWTMPVKLAREDYLPKLLKDPGYLESHGFSLYASWAPDAPRLDSSRINWKSVGNNIGKMRLRQDPGPQNALGQVKFNIPNGFDVYLHDTPSREKFDKSVRTFSSGCVRVGKPLELADFVLAGNPEWPAERRQQQLDKGETKTVVLKQPVTVHLLYQTAWVDDAGTVQFREDIYGRDAELLEAVARRSGGLQRVAEAR